jgi:ABC-type Fe3+-hydroxamate transport system substrate-binding protein
VEVFVLNTAYFYQMFLLPQQIPATAPHRIVSLVPSITELLYALGLQNNIAGITKFCIHPPHLKNNSIIIGGTKNLRIPSILQLQPDLVIANKEENLRNEVEILAAQIPVLLTDVSNLEDALNMIKQIGSVTHTSENAAGICYQVQNQFKQIIKPYPSLNACYMIWQQPYMVAGGDTFISNMMQYCGLNNIYQQQSRYPSINIKELTEKKCDLLLLSTEPYPFTKQHVAQLSKALPATKVIMADGEMFSWYGSRLIQAPAYFTKLLQNSLPG